MRVVLNPNPGKMEGMHVLGILGLIALALARFFPFKALPFTLCHFRAITGLPCPTCGMTTCFIHMTHGEVLQALAISPLGVLVFFYVLAIIVFMIGHRIWRWPSVRLQLGRGEKAVAIVLGIAVVLLNWAYNIFHVTLHKI